jgi:O-methyltransferase involved in polyketide biosynthesis
MPVAAGRGEPWRTFAAPGGMAAWLQRHGFGAVGQAGQRDSVRAALSHRPDSLRPARLPMPAHATVLA